MQTWLWGGSMARFGCDDGYTLGPPYMWYSQHKLSERDLPLTMGEVINKSLPVGGSSTGMVNRPQLSLSGTRHLVSLQYAAPREPGGSI